MILEEKTYKTMGGAGALNIVLGVVSLCVGIASGVLLIISGAKLLAGKSKILFYKIVGIFTKVDMPTTVKEGRFVWLEEEAINLQIRPIHRWELCHLYLGYFH